MDPTICDLNTPLLTGTTIIGVSYNGGIVLGADSRTSIGMYVANRASDKITQLTDNVYLCRSGSAADTQTISDYVRNFLHQHTLVHYCGALLHIESREYAMHLLERGLFLENYDTTWQLATVKVAANLVRLLAYNNKNMLQAGLIVGEWDKYEGSKIYGVPLGETILEQPFSIEAGLIVGGWDKYEGGKIYGVPLGGTILEQPFSIGGSGSSYLYGFFDQAWKEGMNQEEAEQLVVKVVSLAIARDGASSGVVRTVTINSEGVTRKFYPGDSLPLWHEELEPHESLLDILSTSNPQPMDS